MSTRLFMVVEHYRDGDAVAVYRRFRERGRMAPEGLTYVASWVDDDLRVCYQLMETDERALLDQWIANWTDLVEFEVVPVITSAEAAEKVAPQLEARSLRENEGPAVDQTTSPSELRDP